MAHDAAFDEDVLEAATKWYEAWLRDPYKYPVRESADLNAACIARGRAIDADNERAEAEAEAARRLEHQIGSAENDRKW